MATATFNDSYFGPIAATLIKKGARFYWKMANGNACGGFKPFDSAGRAISAAKAHRLFSNVVEA